MIERFLEYAHIKLSGLDFLRLIWAGIAAVFTYIFGGADKWLIGLLVLVGLDYVSGVAAAAIHNELDSRRGFAGILKKVLLFCIVGVANIIDDATGAGGVLRSLSIGFLMANEGISVLENSGHCGIPLPKKLMAALEQLKGQDNDIDNNVIDENECEDGEPYENDGSGD